MLPIQTRRQDAESRIRKYTEQARVATAAAEAAQEDLLEIEQEEAEEKAKADAAAEVEGRKPRLYNVAINDVDMNMLITLLGYNISIPELTADPGTPRNQHAAAVINGLRDVLSRQYYRYHGPKG